MWTEEDLVCQYYQYCLLKCYDVYLGFNIERLKCIFFEELIDEDDKEDNDVGGGGGDLLVHLTAAG